MEVFIDRRSHSFGAMEGLFRVGLRPEDGKEVIGVSGGDIHRSFARSYNLGDFFQHLIPCQGAFLRVQSAEEIDIDETQAEPFSVSIAPIAFLRQIRLENSVVVHSGQSVGHTPDRILIQPAQLGLLIH